VVGAVAVVAGVAVTVTAGTTYYIFVDGYTSSVGGSLGDFTLDVTSPP
jgi:hypothetical protein